MWSAYAVRIYVYTHQNVIFVVLDVHNMPLSFSFAFIPFWHSDNVMVRQTPNSNSNDDNNMQARTRTHTHIKKNPTNSIVLSHLFTTSLQLFLWKFNCNYQKHWVWPYKLNDLSKKNVIKNTERVRERQS